MATPIGAATPRARPAPRLNGIALPMLALAVTFSIVVGIQVLGDSASNGTDGIGGAGVAASAYGAGYPLQGGLAGPSRVGQARSAGLVAHQGPGYPLHGGLAGPSRLSLVDAAGQYGPGYPLHGGLAGPSRIGDGD